MWEAWGNEPVRGGLRLVTQLISVLDSDSIQML